MSFISDIFNAPEKMSAFVGACLALAIPLFFNLLKDLWFDFRKRKAESNYICVQLVFLLDKFTAECVAVSWDKGYDPYWMEPQPEELEEQVRSPVFDLSTVKGDYKSLKPRFLYQLHTIDINLIKIKEALEYITDDPSYSPSNGVYYFSERRRQYVNLALYSAGLSESLKVKFKIKPDNEWNPKEKAFESLKQLNRERSRSTLLRMQRRAKRIMERKPVPF